MQKVVIILTIVILGLFCLQAEEISYTNSWGNAGLNLDAQSSNGVEFTFSIQQFYLENTLVEGIEMKTVKLPGVFLPNDEGAPNLPGVGRYIALPQGANATVRVLSSRVEKIQNIDVAPAPRIPLETETGPLDYHRDMSIYSQNAFYPENPVRLSEQTQVRGVDAVILGITPFQYNPVTKELLIYRDLKVEVSFQGGNGHFGENRLRSRWWDPLLRDMFINQESLPEMDYNYTSNSEGQDYEYVIIVPDNPDFTAWADSIKQFRTLQGIRTGVVTLTEIGGNNANLIESYIDNAYNTWAIPPAAVLLMADYGTGSATGNGITSPTYSGFVSDHIYADVNNNKMADVILARMTATNSAQLSYMVGKALNYERHPSTNPDFYNHPVTAMGYQSDRWFQLCSEIINGFFEYGLGKQPVRENAGYTNGQAPPSWSTNQNTSIIVNYFGPTGLGYIPATPSHLTDWGGNATRLNNDLNSGAFILQHRDHGGTTGWSEPSYHNTDLVHLNNNDLPFVFSINCLTGKFNIGGDCFAEAFHRYPKRALGIIAASETSYSFVNDTYVWGMYDNMWPDFMPGYGTTPASRGILPAFANAAGKYFLQQSNWPYNPQNKEVTYYLFHDHGDAFTNLYSEMPQNLTVSHSAILYGGQTTFSVTADQDALISLTVNGEIIGTGVGTGMPVDINIPPQIPGNEMLVTVTKQNYYRYTQKVMITTASGPYLYVMSPMVYDLAWNGNGVPEAGETVDMSLHLTNLGVEPATNVIGIISSSDTFITIINDSTILPNINVSDTITAGLFSIQIHSDCPHMHHCQINLHLEADSAGVPGGYSWDQTLHMIVHEGAKIVLAQDSLAFPETYLNFTSTLTMPVQNTGPDTLWITDVTSNATQFVPSPTNLMIPPGSQAQIDVDFTPDTTLLYTGTITVKNTDPVNFVTTFTVKGTGIFAPILVTPDSIPQYMTATDSVTIPVTIQNAGPGVLSFNAQITGYDPNNLLEGAGGSDTYGHMWIDSDEPTGPIFNWIDITGSGTLMNLTGNNSISEKITVGLPFKFYGLDYDKFRVCTNGWLSFTTYSVAYNNQSLPSNLAPRALIAPLWDDLNFQQDSKVYYENLGNKFVVLFENIYRITGEGPMTFEVVLYDNNNIVLQYLTLNNIMHDYTVGIQNHLANDGLTVAFNETYLHDGLAILISRHSWVRVSPMSGAIQPFSSMDLSMTFITHNFPYGDFWAGLQLENNDPYNQIAIVPIHMRVGLTGIEEADAYTAKEFTLFQNSPNPFNPTTLIVYNLPKTGDVELTIYNLLGQKVRTLVKGRQEASLHRVVWDGNNSNGVKVSSGIYIYRLKAGDKIAVKKMILMK